MNNPFTRQGIPGWLANMLLFGLLIIIVLAGFFWQIERINTNLQRNAMDRARMVAVIIEENLQKATLTEQTIDEIVTGFLHDKAKFIEYLDGVEPMHEAELAALARETGLLGISLVRPGNRIITAPAGWLPARVGCGLPDGRLYYQQQRQIGYLVHRIENNEQDLNCVVVGLDGARILNLRQKTSLPVLLQSLSTLPGINFIHLDTDRPGDTINTEVTLLRHDSTMTAVATMRTNLGILEVGLDAQFFLQRRNATQSQFIVFGLILLLLGLFFSWLLYRFQQRSLQQVAHFERMLAREHEAAALGRATATIAHEVRNPLNAINMGLQRLQIESDNLNPEQEEMLLAMAEAVSRTSTIVTGLQRFIRDLQPRKEPVQLADLIKQVLTLYRPICSDQGISLTSTLLTDQPVSGDRDLLAEMLENLVKNSVEAQPDGGFLDIGLRENQDSQIMTISNKGFRLTGRDRLRPGEPYFTSKIRGTGLGLALCRRIAEAHGGKLKIITSPKNEMFTVEVTLKVYRPDAENDT
jgi:signal transduction histidine kinase